MSGRWVVLLHGQPGSAADWQQVVSRLPDGVGVVAQDRPGYGASPRSAGGFTAGARAVLADLDARGIDRAVLVGHSYGGGVALATAQLAPERVEALILLAGVGPGCLTWADRVLAGPGHHLPRRAAPQIAAAIAEFLDMLDNSRGAAA